MSKEKNKIATSIVWQGLERVGSYGIGFIVSVILANKLPVEDFGVVTIMTVFVTLSNVFIDSFQPLPEDACGDLVLFF